MIDEAGQGRTIFLAAKGEPKVWKLDHPLGHVS
jgi:hypothetical protein